MPVIFGRHAGGLLNHLDLLQAILVTEAVVGRALFHQLQGIVLKHPHALALNIGPHRAADIRALIPHKAGFLERIIDNIHSAFHIALLIGVLDSQNKLAALGFCHQKSIQGRSEISHVHISCGAGGKPGPHLIKIHVTNPSFPELQRLCPGKCCAGQILNYPNPNSMKHRLDRFPCAQGISVLDPGGNPADRLYCLP